MRIGHWKPQVVGQGTRAGDGDYRVGRHVKDETQGKMEG